jgi:serine/threonine protein kinase
VHLARHVPTSTYCAAKLIDLDRHGIDNLTTTLHEISVFLQVSHPYISKLFHLSRHESTLVYFMEFVPNGTLRQYSDLFPQGLQEYEAQRLFSQIFSALLHCHINHFLVHRDLKLENIMLDSNMNAKLIDFGLSDTFYFHTLHGFAGTLGYCPPEVLAGGSYDEKCDVWSLGVCLYRLATGHLPFRSRKLPVRDLLDASEKLELPDSLSPQLRDILKQMLTGSPQNRPSLIELQNHPFLKKFPVAVKNDKLTPKPIVFYVVNRYEDIAKFRRNPVIPDPQIVESCLRFIPDSAECIIQSLEQGKLTPATAAYFMLQNATHDRPRLAKLPPLSARKPPATRKNEAQITKPQKRPSTMPKGSPAQQAIGTAYINRIIRCKT